jgi:hypothetical protein
MRYFTNIFLRIEEDARTYFEHVPFLHAFLAGIGVVLFWRGVWEYADRLHIHPLLSLGIGILLLGGIGLFLQTFVGNTLIIKSVKKEARLEQQEEKKIEKVAQEMQEEEVTLAHISEQIKKLEAMMKGQE